MSESHNIHWAQDEELLERFVLGRIASQEIEMLERHLSECDECLTTVTRERELVAGIRRVGRDSLKQRLSHTIEQRKSKNVNWYRIAGVAAGIVLLVTLGIYNRWFTGSDASGERQEIADKFEKRAEPSTAVSQETPRTDADKKLSDVAQRAADSKAEKVQGLAAGAPAKQEDEGAKTSEAQVDRLKEMNAVGGRADTRANEKKDRFAAASVRSAGGETWIQGAVIGEQQQNAPAARAILANAEEAQGILRKGKEQIQGVSEAAKLQSTGMAAQPFVITQQPVSALPVSQRAQQRGGFSIQTLLQKDPNGVHMTVFLDSLLSSRDLQQVHAQPIGEDSIILNLGNQRVGYKLPPGWVGQGAQRVPKMK